MAEAQDATRAVFKITIKGAIEKIFEELTRTDGLQGAVFNARLTLPGPGLVAGKKMQMRTGSGKTRSLSATSSSSTRRAASRTPTSSRSTAPRPP